MKIENFNKAVKMQETISKLNLKIEKTYSQIEEIQNQIKLNSPYEKIIMELEPIEIIIMKEGFINRMEQNLKERNQEFEKL